MPELRKDPVINRWVIISTERAKRPHDFMLPKEEKKGGFCPFDYGNEHTTPPEIMAFRPADTEPNTPGWWIRVVPNKFPALDPSLEPERYGHGMYDAMKGFGAHEVVIETADHNTNMALMNLKQVEEIIWAYKHRYEALIKREGIKYVLIFKNHGSLAGASLEHPHSQIIATPIVPKRVHEELVGSREYYSFKERCVFCDMINQERLENARVVEINDDFISFEPFASRFPFETWIMPRRHVHSFKDITDSEIKGFAQILRNTLYKIYVGLDNPPYNFMLHTAPETGEGSEYYHWHLEIVPRLTKVAGFEWGSGFYINPTPPEEAAKFLREIKPGEQKLNKLKE